PLLAVGADLDLALLARRGEEIDGAGANAGLPADLALGVEGELQPSGAGEVDAIGGAPLAYLPVLVPPPTDVLAIGVGEAVPDVDKGAAGGFDAWLVDAIEIGRIARGRARPHRWRAHPEERPAVDLERVDQPFGPLRIDLLPLIGADRDPLA